MDDVYKGRRHRKSPGRMEMKAWNWSNRDAYSKKEDIKHAGDISAQLKEQSFGILQTLIYI